jgi:HlyD family secretion protein
MAKSRSFVGPIILVVFLAAVGTGGWFFYKQSAAKPPEYTTVTVTRGDLTQAVTATGDLQPVLNVNVSSQVSGIIQKLYVDWNSPVKQGDLLAQLDPSTYQTALQQSEGSLANAKANFDLMKANAQRSRELFAKQLIPQGDMDSAEAQLAQAQAQVLIQTANNETAKVNLTRCNIYSPIDGIVISRQVDVGNTVAASLSAPTLFQIANDLTSMQIDTAISEADIGTVQEKQNVTFTVDAYPNRQFRGVVTQIRNSPKTQQNVVIYDTMINVRNDDLRLKPGMTANVSVIVAQRTGALKVANAVLRVRVPESLLPPKPAGAGGDKGGAKPMTDDERRKQFQQLMADAGYQRGNGPPSPDVMAKVQELAKQRGIEIPENFGRGGRGGGGGGGRSAAESGAPVTRTVYKLVGSDPKTARPEPVTARFGITDGVATEIIDGLNEGDVLITSVVIPGAKTATPQSTNPFGGGSSRGMGGFGR